ncbi:hypothetical protein NQD34_009102 [Periophthalmus magnuspinnatus]|nr:hypothetical protein NQD34_009102 [Periophthalmus magnuspinnatus]
MVDIGWSHLQSCGFVCAPLPAGGSRWAACTFMVDILENKRTGSLFKIWLTVPSLLELCWEKLLKVFPHLTTLPTMQLLNLGFTQELIERLE